MKTRQILYATLSFLAVDIGICPYVVAASTLQLTQTSQEISGTDSESGVAFRASLLASDHVIVDFYIGTKRNHAEIDYGRQALRVRSVSQANETPIALSVQDILAFQRLRISLPPKIHTSARHGDALASLINLMADAPDGIVIDISSGSFTSICPQIGKPSLATFRLGRFSQEYYHIKVTVGPVCYMGRALGRCGAGAGPDPGIGFQQKFTQECLNHDVCCDKTKEPSPVCGFGCAPAFGAAAPGYIFAPDCGTTAGNWSDSNGFDIAVFSGGDSRGTPPQPFAGVLNTNSPLCQTAWSVDGTRTGTQIGFTATNPSGPSRFCAASYTVTGDYTGCNKAMGTWSNSAGGSGMWSWTRLGTVRQTVLSSRANAGPRSADK